VRLLFLARICAREGFISKRKAICINGLKMEQLKIPLKVPPAGWRYGLMGGLDRSYLLAGPLHAKRCRAAPRAVKAGGMGVGPCFLATGFTSTNLDFQFCRVGRFQGFIGPHSPPFIGPRIPHSVPMDSGGWAPPVLVSDWI
jgi:hypothetical protein